MYSISMLEEAAVQDVIYELFYQENCKEILSAKINT